MKHQAVLAVLFDAAETLFTTRASVGEMYASVAQHYGSHATPSDIQEAFIRQFRNSGPLSKNAEREWWKDTVHRVFLDVGMVRDFDAFFDRVYDLFKTADGWTLFPETRDVLAAVRTKGLKTAVVSNFDSRIYGVLEGLGIRSYFDAVAISSETGYAKPHARIFHAAIAAVGTAPENALMVGDSLTDDVQGAKLAGLEAVLVDRNRRYQSLQSVTRIADLRELLPLLG